MTKPENEEEGIHQGPDQEQEHLVSRLSIEFDINALLEINGEDENYDDIITERITAFETFNEEHIIFLVMTEFKFLNIPVLPRGSCLIDNSTEYKRTMIFRVMDAILLLKESRQRNYDFAALAVDLRLKVLLSTLIRFL